MSIFASFFYFTLWSARTAIFNIGQLLFCCLSQGLAVKSRLGDECYSLNSREHCMSHSPGQIMDCAYREVKFKFITQFPVDHFPYRVASCFIHFFHQFASFMWLIITRLYHHIAFICYFVAFVFTFIKLVLMALFCVVIRKDSISFLRFPFLSHVQIFSCEISLFILWNIHTSVSLLIFVSPLNCCFTDHCVVFVASGRFLCPLFISSLSLRIDASTLTSMVVSPLPPSFLDPSMGCKD